MGEKWRKGEKSEEKGGKGEKRVEGGCGRQVVAQILWRGWGEGSGV